MRSKEDTLLTVEGIAKIVYFEKKRIELV